jgi:succinate dehydrogenase / fumarate reductase cytochrome b subunit
MSWWLSFYRTSLGKKAVMAVTGILLFGFVLVHMIGNLKMYLGEESFNTYAHWLREVGYPALPHEGGLWIFRIVLLVAVALHFHAAYALTIVNWKARPKGYKEHEELEATYASRTMRWGGAIIGLFVLYHLAHLTTGWAHPSFVEGEAYANVVAGFTVWWVSVFYVIANIALGFHLYHGLWSMFRSLGWNRPGVDTPTRRFAQVFAWVITLGNLSFPIAVLSGVVA